MVDPSCALPFMNPVISIPIFFLCLVCAFSTLLILRVTRSKREAKIVSVKYIPSELMSYTLPYVVSFIGVGFQEQSKFLGILIFLGWMFWITHKSGQIVLNPLLVVFGWKLYEVKILLKGEETEQEKWALSKMELAVADRVYATEMQDVWITKEQESAPK
jgi:4-hydroxybenzoate polyprenyltransferase